MCHDMRTKFHRDLLRRSKVEGEGGDTQIHRQHGDHISLFLLFQNEESRLKQRTSCGCHVSMSVTEVASTFRSLEDYLQILYGRLSLKTIWNSQSYLSIIKPSLDNVTNGRFHVCHKHFADYRELLFERLPPRHCWTGHLGHLERKHCLIRHVRARLICVNEGLCVCTACCGKKHHNGS
jgi:hypothetical protein